MSYQDVIRGVMARLDAAGIPRVAAPLYLLEIIPERRAGRGRYWAPGSKGYTDDLSRAGLYPEAEARAIEAKSDRTVAILAEPVLRQALAQADYDSYRLRDMLARIENNALAFVREPNPTPAGASPPPVGVDPMPEAGRPPQNTSDHPPAEEPTSPHSRASAGGASLCEVAS